MKDDGLASVANGIRPQNNTRGKLSTYVEQIKEIWKDKYPEERNKKQLKIVEKDIVTYLRGYMEHEVKSCSMDFGCITMNMCSGCGEVR